MVDFVKAHGTGNDFVVIGDLDNQLTLSAETVKRACDRHFGIGADGVIRIGRSARGEFFMDYVNADGTLAEMCGNGVRVVGKWLGDRGFADAEVDVDTRAGIKRLTLQRSATGLVETVTVDMGPPVGDVRVEKLDVDGTAVEATLVSMGNPHAVLFVPDVDTADVAGIGSSIERHSYFPEGTNVEFVDRRGHVLRQRTWERGVGETLACGTGACAVSVAGAQAGLCGDAVDIDLRGGRLRLEHQGNGHVFMTGPAVEVFAGSVDLSFASF